MNITDATKELDEAINDGVKTLDALRTIRAELGSHAALREALDRLAKTDGVLMELCQLLGLDPTGDVVAEMKARLAVKVTPSAETQPFVDRLTEAADKARKVAKEAHTAEPEPTPAISPFPAPVDIEAVFARRAPVPEGWVLDPRPMLPSEAALRRLRVALFPDSEVRYFPPSRGHMMRHYPTIARAWEVAQDIARRLEAGEEVNELPPAE